MNTPSAISTSLGCLLLCAGVLSVTPGCMDSESFPDTDGPEATEGPAPEGPSPVALSDGSQVVSEYVLQVRPRSKTTKLVRLKPGVSGRPGFTPQSVDSINAIQDDTPGAGPANSVELNTTDVTYGATCPGGQAASFCGTVVLGSFYTRPLNNVFVQVTSITDVNGVALTGHSGINSDSAPSWMTGDSSLGLWKYTATAATNAGVIGTSPNNFGTRIWSFANPDDADTNILLRVVSTLSYKDYTRTGPTTATFINSCPTNNDNAANGNDVPLTLPFEFTFYGIQGTTSAIFNRNGVATLGGVTPPQAADNSTFKSITLPDNTLPRVSASPGIYAFWDKLNYNTTQSAICHSTLGTAPNRQFVFAWRNMKGFTNVTNTMNISFNVILTEGSDTIDMVYGVMAGASGNDATSFPTSPTTITNAQRAQGKKAIIGVQGPNGSVNIATPSPAALGTTTIALSNSQTNVAYRYTPLP